MERYRVDLSALTENDLRNIVRYISAQVSSPITALNMLTIIEEAFCGLALLPQNHPFAVDERLAMLGYHKLPVKNNEKTALSSKV